MAADPRSVLTRDARPPDRTLRYGPRPDHVVDLWDPAGPPIAQVVLLHGGFWRAEYDRRHLGPLAEAFAAVGFRVATPEYRRTGAGGGWPETFDDVRAAVLSLVGERTLLVGHSAGGHLALWAAQPPVAGVVALAPVADLRAAHQLDLDGGAVAALLGGGPDEVPERYAAADPMVRLPVGVPIRLVHGALDRHVPVAFSQRYAAAAQAAGDVVGLDVLPEAEHFAVIDPESAAWPSVLSAVKALVAA